MLFLTHAAFSPLHGPFAHRHGMEWPFHPMDRPIYGMFRHNQGLQIFVEDRFSMPLRLIFLGKV